MEEKKEQIQVMEISLRHQIQEVKEKQFELEQKEKQIIRWEIKAKEKLAFEKECVLSEKEKVAAILEELEEKQIQVLSNCGQSRRQSNSQMPRQMTEKENLPANTSNALKVSGKKRKRPSATQASSKTPVIE